MKNQITFFEKNCIEILFAQSSHNFPLHSHDSFCFGVIEEGEATFCIDGKSRLLRQGMAYVIPPDTGVTIRGRGTYRYITICIKKEWRDFFPDFSPMDFYLDLSSSQAVQELCEDYLLRENPEHFVAEIVRLVKPLYGEAADKSGGGSGQKSPIVEEARAYIRQNVNKKFSLQELAEAIHVSPYYLVRLFKKEMGVTPNQYYIQARMYHAKKELLSRPSEADVAMELNFTDQSHLCNQFRRQMGISPGDYRKNFQRL